MRECALLIYFLFYCFWKKKRNSGKGMKKKAGCWIFVKKERNAGPILGDPRADSGGDWESLNGRKKWPEEK